MVVSLAGLPAEVHKRILDNLAKDDTWEGRKALGKLRLSGDRTVEARVAPVLLSTIGFWLSFASLKNLAELSEHPLRAKFVKRIIFTPLHFARTQLDTLAAVTDQMQFEPFTLNQLNFVQLSHLAAVSKYRAEIEELEREGLACKILTRTLKNLTNLKTLVIQGENYFIGARELLNNFGSTFVPQLFDSSGKVTLDIMFHALKRSGIRITTLRVESSIRSVEPLKRLALPKPLQGIEARALAEAITEQSDLESWTSELEQVDFDGIKGNSSVPNAFHEYMMSLGGFLDYAQKLKKLTIDCSVFDIKHVDLNNYIRVIPRLQQISFSHFENTDPAGIRIFYRRCSETLRRVHWEFPRDEWSKLLRSLRDLQWPNLESFTIDRGWGIVEGASFVMRETDEIPEEF